MQGYAVKAETHEGKIVLLRNGFASREAAEDHPITIKLWKRVWVEEVEIKPVAPASLPPFPWNWVAATQADSRGSFHAYLVDATGRKIGAIWGKDTEKKLIADHIVEAANKTAPVD